MTILGVTRGQTRFFFGASVLLCLYLVTVPLLWKSRGVIEDGPLSFYAPALREPFTEGLSIDEVKKHCRDAVQGPADEIKIVGGEVDGRKLYGCYALTPEDTVAYAVVLDQELLIVRDVALIKRSGAWRWIGVVKTPLEVTLGFLGLVGIITMYFIYYRRPRPGARPRPHPWFWQGRTVDIAAWFMPCLGWLAIWALPGRTRARKIRLSFLYTFAYITFFLVGIFSPVMEYPDPVSLAVTGVLSTALVWGWLGGRALVRPEEWGYPDGEPDYRPSAQGFYAEPTAVQQPAPTGSVLFQPAPAPAQDLQGGNTPAQHHWFKVQQPGQLPTFSDVGGMAQLKNSLAETFGLLLAFSEQAENYRVTFNGVLLHGPTGVGKTFIARATAGEFGLTFVHVTTGDLVSKWLGESAKNISAAFRVAAANIPCLLFFDEFDSVALRRDDEADSESRRTVNQLLTSLEDYRSVTELIVMAATNHLEQLDPAVVRPGRFDRHVRIDLPDASSRRAVLAAQLRNRPAAGSLDLDAVTVRTEGLTPAALTAVVEGAALAAFRESITTGYGVPISTQHLLGSLIARGGTDRPAAAAHTWDDLVLDPRTKSELQQLQRLVESTDLSRRLGIEPPSGLLLVGPPGTGKTTVARVFAAQAHCSFYATSAADLTSKWVGESERRIQAMFARARDNAPSIIFLDELDAVAHRRQGFPDVTDRQLTQLLVEIDGLGPRASVFVIGATNRPDMLDPSITRGGRLSRTISIPLPDHQARVVILERNSKHMPLADFEMDTVARVTEGLSGGDLRAVCQQAAVHRLMRASATTGSDSGDVTIELEDFAAAVVAIRASRTQAPTHGL